MLIQTIGEVVKKLSSDFLDRTPEIPWKNIKESLINSAPPS